MRNNEFRKLKVIQVVVVQLFPKTCFGVSLVGLLCGCCGLGAASVGENHEGLFFPSPLFSLRLPAGGVVEGDSRGELFHLALYVS